MSARRIAEVIPICTKDLVEGADDNGIQCNVFSLPLGAAAKELTDAKAAARLRELSLKRAAIKTWVPMLIALWDRWVIWRKGRERDRVKRPHRRRLLWDMLIGRSFL